MMTSVPSAPDGEAVRARVGEADGVAGVEVADAVDVARSVR